MVLAVAGLLAGACASSTPTAVTVPFVSDPAPTGLVSAVCPRGDAAFGVFFNPGSGATEIEPVLTALEKSPYTGLVGYVDQTAGYQEFQSLFSGNPDVRNTLSVTDIPPSLRVFVAAGDLNRAKAAVTSMPGVLRVSTPATRQSGSVAIGTLQYERGTWRKACKLGPWQEGTPPISVPPSITGTLPTSGLYVFDVGGGNMEPALRPGDKVDVSLGKQPSRGRIVVLKAPASDAGVNYVIERVIGMPGETITASGGHVLVDGRTLSEPWLPAGVTTNSFGPVRVPAGSYFVMGDNRGDSADSRVYGPVPAASVAGVAFAIVYPLNRARPLG